MRFHQVLAVFILVTAGVIAAVPVDSTRHTTVAERYTTIRHSRILRTEVKLTDAEERGIWSNIKSWFKSTYWAYSGTTKAQVEEKLGFKGLSEAKRKASPKYKTYEQYLYKIEGFKLDDWVYRRTYTPSSLWSSLKLNPNTYQKGSSELQFFERFLRRYEKQVYNGYKGYDQHFGKSEAEKMSYLKVWANADREESYIKRMLDIDHGDSHYDYYYKHMSTSWKPENEIKGHTNYVYLQNYRELRKRMWS